VEPRVTTVADPRTEPGARPAGHRPAAPRRRRPWSTSKLAVNTALVLAAAYTLFPAAWMLLAAAKTGAGLMAGVFSLKDLDLAGNLSRLVHQDHGIYLRWCLNSLLYAGGGAVLCALVSVAAGYAFDKYAFRGKEKLFALVLVGVLVPTSATAIPLYLLASKVHLVNTVWAVLIPSVVNPFLVYLGRVFSAGYVPDEVLEAARIDGAGELRIFFSIALPMLRSGFTTMTLFQFSAIWNGFFLALMMLSNLKLYPVTLGIYIWSMQAATDPYMKPLAICGAVIAVVPVVLLFLCLQRYWRSGLTAGAVK
jgi:multiple sugar transport system permease protein